MEMCFECLGLIHENSFTKNHTFPANENIYVMVFMQFEKKLQPAMRTFPLCLASQSIFFPPPILIKKKSNFCRLHLVPDFQSDKSVTWIFPSPLSVFMKDRLWLGRWIFSICLVQERQIYSLGVPCNLQPTYFLPLLYFFFCLWI